MKAFRSRFKSAEKDCPENGNRGQDQNCNGERNHSPQSCGAEAADQLAGSPEPTTDTAVMELQLTLLQEQLVAAMIENQNLNSELETFKDEHNLQSVLRDLEYQKQRNQQLETELQVIATKEESAEGSGSWVDVGQEVTEEAVFITPGSKAPLFVRMKECLISQFYELMADFTEDPEPDDKHRSTNETLAVKTLKENIKRFRDGTKPIFTTGKGVHGVFTWKYPAFTFLVFILFMYAVWHGWLLPLVLFLMIFRLVIAYFKNRGWNIDLHFLNIVEDEENQDESNQELGVSDKFNLVLQVATKVQNFLGDAADNLEKIKNLLNWRHSEATLQLLIFLVMSFLLCCYMSGTTLFTLAGLYMGFKMFILEYLYTRFPRFKHRHDTIYKVWNELPTDADIRKKDTRKALKKHMLSPSRSLNFENGSLEFSPLSEVDKSFCDTFNIPYSEKPLPTWQNGRRCTFIEKDKPLTSAFKNGRLYLTTSFLCFERNRYPSPKNMIIPLTDITGITKVKPYNWIPGSGMSLEITTKGFDKPFLFGAILNRDEVYSSVVQHSRKADIPWAIRTPPEEDDIKSEEGLKVNNEENKREPENLTFRMSDLQENQDPDLDLDVLEGF